MSRELEQHLDLAGAFEKGFTPDQQKLAALNQAPTAMTPPPFGGQE